MTAGAAGATYLGVLELFTRFSEVFVPLFVALNPLTVLPIFLSMTESLEPAESRKMSRRAVITALSVSIALVFLGQALFRFLGITLDDLRVAGGSILFVIAVHDLIFQREDRKRKEMGDDVGVVPLGVPLIVGPATMTACIVLADSHGRGLVLVALGLNLALIAAIMHFSDVLKRAVRPAVARAFGKVMSLFLASIAVAMFRSGVRGFMSGG